MGELLFGLLVLQSSLSMEDARCWSRAPLSSSSLCIKSQCICPSPLTQVHLERHMSCINWTAESHEWPHSEIEQFIIRKTRIWSMQFMTPAILAAIVKNVNNSIVCVATTHWLLTNMQSPVHSARSQRVPSNLQQLDSARSLVFTSCMAPPRRTICGKDKNYERSEVRLSIRV